MDVKNLNKIRHSLTHLLAAAVLELYPDAKPSIGPAITDGFYYDFGKLKINEADLPKIEAKMRDLLPSWEKFSGREVPVSEAREFFKKNPYKLELIDELEKAGEKITFYTAGDFVDLCRGGHLENPAKEINSGAFQLNRLAGAYWRGDEKNEMLTRIYGLAFQTKKGLNDFTTQRAEAETRDHRKLGRELDLFTTSELVGPGLPLWTPKGTLVRDLLDNFVWELRGKAGYERVDIPHLAKKELYEKSGHWEKFQGELFKINTREGHQFVIKPMNCPHHIEIYRRRKWSYRELPQRYASTTKVYRDEQTGELIGLSRVRGITQDDAHVFCRENQIKEEFLKIWGIVHQFYGALNFKLKVQLSFHDPKTPEKYLGEAAQWQTMEQILREIVAGEKTEVKETPGEAAFYGPKLDFMASDSLDREWQVATIQLDMNLPERFNLVCVNEEGGAERIFMLHATIMGSLERFIATLLEHTGGHLPLWLSPTQIIILPISDKHQEFANSIYQKLLQANLRARIDAANETLAKKIKRAKTERIPYLVVIGDKETGNGKLTAEGRQGKLEGISVEELTAKLDGEIKEKRPG